MTTDPRRDRVAAAFREVAERVGGQYDDAGHWGRPVVQRRDRDWIITAEWATTEQGRHTFIRAPFHNPREIRFGVRNEGLFDDLWKTLGFLHDVQVGDAAFDRRFVVKGHPVERVREVLDEEARRLILTQKHMDLRVLGRRGPYADPGYPAGIDELYFQESSLDDAERLVRLFELFRHLLPRLSRTEPGYHSDVDALVARLLAPGGTVRSRGGPTLFWDGDAPRRDAARRLGELCAVESVPALTSVLADRDDTLAVRAVKALARIGDDRAVGPLVRVLARRRSDGAGSSVADHAAEALATFGEEEIPRSFALALEGDPEPLSRAAGPHRNAVIAALMDLVTAGDLELRPAAARALGALGANEAMPVLREASRAMGMRTRLTEAATSAMEEIERGASLPRPARPVDPGPDTRPRPANEPEHP